MRIWTNRPRRGREATCADVARALQRYLDGHVDDLTARRVQRHLERCRRCGLEAETYQAIKDTLARRGRDFDPESLERLRRFGSQLGGPEGGEVGRL